MKKIFLLAFIALAAPGFAQKISNKISFPKGQKLEMDIVVNSTISSPMGGESKVDATITRSFDIEDVKNGNATIEHKIKRIKVNFESMMGSQTFDSENEKDMQSDAGKAVEKSLKNKYTMTLDQTGKVISVKKDDDNPNTGDSATADMLGNLLSQIAEGLDVPAPGDRTDFKVLPDREVSKGDSWADSVQGRKTVYTLADVTDNDIMINYKEDGTTERKQEAMGMQISISSKDTTTGRIRLDRKTGLLKEKSATTDSDGVMEVMGQKAPLTTKSTKSWLVKS